MTVHRDPLAKIQRASAPKEASTVPLRPPPEKGSYRKKTPYERLHRRRT
jgi:hypothetical protein